MACYRWHRSLHKIPKLKWLLLLYFVCHLYFRIPPIFTEANGLISEKKQMERTDVLLDFYHIHYSIKVYVSKACQVTMSLSCSASCNTKNNPKRFIDTNVTFLLNLKKRKRKYLRTHFIFLYPLYILDTVKFAYSLLLF